MHLLKDYRMNYLILKIIAFSPRGWKYHSSTLNNLNYTYNLKIKKNVPVTSFTLMPVTDSLLLWTLISLEPITRPVTGDITLG